ncbi:MAG TPA: TolC family protein [Pirellulales bacterium]|nr:TolC family protein [Pirellulales bacterium]
MSRQAIALVLAFASVIVSLSGCTPTQPFYFMDDKDLSHYKGVATQIETPDVDSDRINEVQDAQPPLTVANAEAREIWDLTLQEAIQISVSNSKVMRSLGVQAFVPTTFSGGTRFGDPTRLSTTPTSVPSTYTPSIVESDPRFGTEAALSAFDAQLSSSLFWYKNDQPQNISNTSALSLYQASIFRQDLMQDQTQISKRLVTGGTAYLRQYTIYNQNNNGANIYPSVWTPYIEAEFSHPLLQGAGTQFNRIATSAQTGSSGGNNIPGYYNGVVIARINHDIALADLEVGARNLVDEVETAYWRLYFNYRDLDAKMVGRDSALQTWRKIHALFQESARGGEAEKEAQARAQYFLFRGQVEAALSDLYTSENQVRFIMGLAATDGRLIRPSDEPTTARVQFDWYEVHAEALARSPELRQERWRVKQHELQLAASKSFLLPTLNVDALYRWRGFGNNLGGPVQSGIYGSPTSPPFQNAYQTLLSGAFQEWQLGFNFNMPLGFRQGLAAVRNEQLQLARERAVLQDQELELSHQLSNAVRSLDRFYMLSQTNFNRRVASQKQVDAVRAAYETQTVTLDLLLEAQRALADSESTYYDALSLYNLAICQVHLRKNSLLEYNGVHMAEGPWADKAYFDARKRARERDAGLFVNYGFARPNVISRGAINQFYGRDNGVIPDNGGNNQSGENIPAGKLTPEPGNIPGGDDGTPPASAPAGKEAGLPSGDFNAALNNAPANDDEAIQNYSIGRANQSTPGWTGAKR